MIKLILTFTTASHILLVCCIIRYSFFVQGGYLPLAQGPDDADSDDSDDGEEFGQFNSAAEKGKVMYFATHFLPVPSVIVIKSIHASLDLPLQLTML